MNRILLSCLTVIVCSVIQAQTICNPNGNVVLYSNYDGGYLRINVDQNIPNLKIGVTTYEAIQVEITGAYASNVTQVIYAGYAGTNDHCGTGHNTVGITGVPASNTNIMTIPAATWPDPNGYPNIICAYNCSGTTGGCNTAEQISHFFLTQFGGSLYSHFTQYGCYNYNSPFNVGNGGNCCAVPNAGSAPVAAFSANTTNICEGECVSFTDLSTNIPTSWTWSFQGATTATSGLQNPANICFPAAGNYSVSLTATNTNGSNTLTMPAYITVHANPPVPVITQNFNMLVSSAATGNQWYFNNNLITGATSQTYYFTQNGNYKVKVTNTQGCSNMSAAYNVSNTGIGEIAGATWQVYPNPSTGKLYIQTPGKEQKVFRLMTVTGAVIHSEIFEGMTYEMSTEGLAEGMYLLEVGGRNFKVVVAH